MKMIYSSIMVIFCGFGYSLSVDPSSYGEIDLGRNYPTGLYDKYADAGFSARYSFSRAFKRKNTLREGLFKWQVGIQYIHFRSDYWTDEVQGTSGNALYNIEIKNYEQGFVFNGGFRLTASNGLTKNGNFRPYIGGLIGMSIFSEKTTYDWGDDCDTFGYFLDILLDADYCDNNNNTTDLEHRTSSPTFTLDIGTNIFFDEVQDVGLDIGVRYNMLTRLKRPDIVYDDTNNTFDKISNYMEADYYTIYIGVVWKVNTSKNKRKKSKGGRLI